MKRKKKKTRNGKKGNHTPAKKTPCSLRKYLTHLTGRQSTGKISFDTVRKQRAAFSGVWRASALGQSREMIVSGAATKKMTVSRCPAYCVWFEYFMKGLEKFMSRETRPDLALDIKVTFRVMELLGDD